MKGLLFAGCVLACLLVGSGCMTGGYTTMGRTHGPEPDSLALTTHDIIDMSRAKIGDDVIIKMIRTTGSYFNLRSRDVVVLADSGVSDKVLEAMINTGETREYRGSGYYYQPNYPGYWWGAYPYFYPWTFGLSLGYYTPFYHRAYIGPRYGHSVPRYHSGTHYYGRSYSSGNFHSGNRPMGGGRSSGRRR
jgi:hypothetical protein